MSQCYLSYVVQLCFLLYIAERVARPLGGVMIHTMRIYATPGPARGVNCARALSSARLSSARLMVRSRLASDSQGLLRLLEEASYGRAGPHSALGTEPPVDC